ncbi:MAG: Flagellar biosynthesis protein FlhB [Phycisphaerales bacterium]|nr:Flagellar biosynthesis protein FlhB [Phycisphaerales bacterium]
MAEDIGDKTEAPTPRRREEAREQGNIARSQDLTAAVLLVSMLLLLKATGPRLISTMQALVARMLGAASLSDLDGVHALEEMGWALEKVGIAMAPLLAGVMVVAVLANVAQVGFHMNLERMQPNLAALNPLKGIGKIFGGGRPVQMLLSIVKLVLLALVAWSAVHNRIVEIVTAQQLGFGQIFQLGAAVVYAIAMRLGIALLILAIIEYAYQKWRIEQDLKMTKQEVKEEMRRMDGDPKIKQRRRQIALQQLKQKLQKDVPTADVVVTNPTEFAVAIKYDATTMHAPRVIAKGQGPIAQRIRELAVAHGVPILERKPLARALYKLVNVGQEVPEQFYSAIAEILAYVYELSGKLRQRQTA